MKKKCKHSWCANITEGQTYCALHTFDKPPKIKRVFESNKFYKTGKWVRMSKILRAEKPICEVCNNDTTDVVDHWWEIRYPLADDYALDPSNLICCCHSCHNKKTAELQRRLRNEKPTRETFLWLEINAPRRDTLETIKEIKARIIAQAIS